MAVITTLEPADIAHALASFDLGRVEDFRPASLGIENTNYFVTSCRTGMDSQGVQRQQRHQLVLTLLETDNDHDSLLVPLLVRLAEAGLPVPAPLASLRGERTGWLRDRPALLSPCLPGQHILAPGPEHCAAIGRFLAAMHQAAAPLAANADPHPRDAAWMHRQAGNLARHLPWPDRQMMDQAIHLWRSLGHRRDLQALPSGIVHGDLFRDNALFNSFGLAGVLDFHHAARHWLLFDLAVVVNDWCADADGNPNLARTLALLRAYHQRRPLQRLELELLSSFLMAAALCFWLARLPAWLGMLGPEAPRKDPADQRAIVLRQLSRPLVLEPLLL